MTSRYFQVGLVIVIVAIAVLLAISALDDNGSTQDASMPPQTNQDSRGASRVDEKEAEATDQEGDENQRGAFRTLREGTVEGKAGGK